MKLNIERFILELTEKEAAELRDELWPHISAGMESLKYEQMRQLYHLLNNRLGFHSGGPVGPRQTTPEEYTQAKDACDV